MQKLMPVYYFFFVMYILVELIVLALAYGIWWILTRIWEILLRTDVVLMRTIEILVRPLAILVRPFAILVNCLFWPIWGVWCIFSSLFTIRNILHNIWIVSRH